MDPGGKGFNVALAVHKLGVPVDGLFAVGDDPAGTFMRHAFADWGLGQEMIRTIDAPTGAGVGLIQDDGENRIAVFPGANALLSADDVTGAAGRIRNAALVFAQFETADAPIAASFALARDSGVTTMLNPSPYRTITAEILGLTDILVLNEQEAEALKVDRLPGDGHDGLPLSLAEAGVKTVIITRGSRGATAWQAGQWVEEPGFPTRPVDSIGAGDAFAGGFAAALAHSHSLPVALRWGCAAGAITASRLGVAQALPIWDELTAMLDRSLPNPVNIMTSS